MMIYLVGMPGSGKTTLGRFLAQGLGYPFVDVDELAERLAGMSIPAFFEKEGEAAFRALEHEALVEAAKAQTSAVVSTGGGIILRAENVAFMKESGRVVFIDRPLEAIASDVEIRHRPLLQKGGVDALRRLYEARYAIYLECCDIHFINDKDEAAAGEALLGLWKGEKER